ncbi:MAG: YfhO family protein [Firmicutes bacterium]|nr:YfhO family protein [Bacillota bacterium]
MGHIKTFIKTHKYILATFAIAFVVMMIGFAVIELFPFGEQQIMVIDSWHQYYPFLQELHHKLQNFESIFYSENIGMGTNFFLIMAYYAFSPLYIFSVLFPREYLREFMMLATAIKIALAGAFFAIYIKHLFKREDYTITAFGLLYAFCGFAMGYYWNIMWLDAMALLPLIILGLHRLIDGEGVILYIVTLAIALISNFYVGYFICEFILFYFFVLYFTKQSGFDIGKLVRKTLIVAGTSLLAVGIAAVVLIPTYKGLQLSHATAINFPTEFKAYYSVLEILNNMLPGTQPTVKAGLPNIYSSFIGLYFLIVYFVSSGIRVKEKVFSFALIVFFIMSFNINYLNFIWHAFHFPNEVPYRFAFIFSFLVLTWAYQAFQHYEETPKKHFWAISFGLLVYLIIGEQFDLKETVFYVTLVALGLYTILFMAHRYAVIRPRAFTIALCVMFLAEILLSGILGTATTGSSGRTSYPFLDEQVDEALEQIYEKDPGDYRVEMVKWYSTNDPALYGYRGVSFFSSTANADVSRYNRAIGLSASPESNRYQFVASTPLINSLYNVKYLIGREGQGTDENAGYQKVLETEKVTLYENKYPLPLGFVVDTMVYNWNNSHRSPFDVQEDFVLAATGLPANLYDDVPISEAVYDNMTEKSFDNIRYSYRNNDSSKVGNATLKFFAPETKQMYLYMFANRSYKTKVTVLEETIEYETRRGLIIDLGVLEAGTEIKLEFETHAAKEGYYNLQVVTFNEDVYEGIHGVLADEPWDITTFKSTKIEGTVTAAQDGVMYTSIPYDPGWTVKVDGAKVEVNPLKKALMMFDVPAGTHEITMTYVPEGFVVGLLISLVSIGGTVAIRLNAKKQVKLAKQKPAEHQ